MKKFVIILISIVAVSTFVSCNDRPVLHDKLPNKAKQFLSTYFTDIEVLSIMKDNGEYEVLLVDGTEVDFKTNGNWKKVDCHGRPVPQGFFPESITNYVASRFPNAFIDEISFEHNRYEVGLNIIIDDDLIFDKNGNFIGVD